MSAILPGSVSPGRAGPPTRAGACGSVQRQVDERDEPGACEQEQEQAEESPAEDRVLVRELLGRIGRLDWFGRLGHGLSRPGLVDWLGQIRHSSIGSAAMATKSSARYASE